MTTSPLSVPPVETPGHGLLTGKKVVVTAAAGRASASRPPDVPCSRAPTC